MGLNVSFKGFAKDENDVAIDCKFQIHFVRQNKWNNARNTTESYYSFNAGSEDGLTQDGDMKSGDVILLTFWHGNGSGDGDDSLLLNTPANRDDVFDRFCVFAITHDGTTQDYVVNVQLKPKLVPNIVWTLPTTGTINRTITALNTSNDETNWVYGTKTFYHRNSYYGRVVFPKVGLLTSTYDWVDPNDAVIDYESSNTHSYTQIGDYVVKLKVVNYWELVSNSTKPIRLKYNVPIGGLSFNPDGVTVKVHTTENSTSTASITDEDNRISSINHNWVIKNRNTLALISDTLVDTNTNKAYSYNKVISVLQKHYSKQVISWNDGWENLVVTFEKELVITNWLPLVNFNFIFLNDTRVRFTPVCSDIDGFVDRYTWNLYALVPFQTGTYALSKTDVFTDDRNVVINFDSAGHYKMVLTARDDYGESASVSREFDVTLSGDCELSGGMTSTDVFFIIPDEYEN